MNTTPPIHPFVKRAMAAGALATLQGLDVPSAAHAPLLRRFGEGMQKRAARQLAIAEELTAAAKEIQAAAPATA